MRNTHETDDDVIERSIVSYSTLEAAVVPDMKELARQMVAGAKTGGVALTGDGGLLTALTKQVLQTALEVELEEHLGYESGDRSEPRSDNHRNGHSQKTVKMDIGEIDIDVPRDRAGTFEPIIVPKHKRRIDGLDEQVLNLYSKGMTTGDICAYLTEIYDTKISRDTVSKITDAVVSEMREWQSRPLDSVYPVIFIDAIFLKVRDGAVANRAVHVAVGINTQGCREILGLWMSPTGGEGAKQWMQMLADLKNRGIQDVLIVCCDGLKGLPDSIYATWPETTVQTCVVHLIRNSLRQVPHKEKKALATDLKTIYTAPTEDAALVALDSVEEKWGKRFPAMIRSWRNNWKEFSPFLKFPPEVRKVIYTTNSIESLNARFRKAIRKRGHFPTEQAALKVLYLAAVRKEVNRPNPSAQVFGWVQVRNALLLEYGDRLGSW